MSFFRTLQFLFSNDFVELQTLLFKNYSGYNMRDVLFSLEQILKEQEQAEHRTGYIVQELDAARADINRICDLCAGFKNSNGRIDRRTGCTLTKEDILQIVSTALEKEENRRGEELRAIKQQEEIIKKQLAGMAVHTQASDKKLSELSQLLANHNLFREEPKIPPSSEQAAEIAALQGQVRELQKELEKYQAYIRWSQEENKGLQARIQELQKKTVKPDVSNPYRITANREKYLICADDREHALAGLGNTMILDQFFENISSDNSYKKMYERYKKKLRKCLEQAEEDELEDVLNAVASVIQSDLLKKIMVAIYRGKKGENSEFEDKLLKVVNHYLESIGFYTRDNICVGGILKNEDYEDMEFIKDERTTGKKHGEITEIELYPYYINYVDEDGQKRNVHTQGMMIVIA